VEGSSVNLSNSSNNLRQEEVYSVRRTIRAFHSFHSSLEHLTYRYLAEAYSAPSFGAQPQQQQQQNQQNQFGQSQVQPQASTSGINKNTKFQDLPDQARSLVEEME